MFHVTLIEIILLLEKQEKNPPKTGTDDSYGVSAENLQRWGRTQTSCPAKTAVKKKKMFSQQISAQQWIFILKASIFNPYPCVEKQSWKQASTLKIAVERFLAKGSLGKEHIKKKKIKKIQKINKSKSRIIIINNPLKTQWEIEKMKRKKKYFI